jgi:carbon monoxide dehydrogenase subunit G
MQMTGQQKIPAPLQQVWDALYDPEILKRCIPGCQSLTKESDARMRATVDIKIGPIGARFNGTVTLSDVAAPKSCTLTIEGQGGTVGFVKSRSQVRLNDDGSGGTVLDYEVDAQVGGRLAQLGGPLIDSTAKQLAGRFFKQFGAVVGKPVAADATAIGGAGAAEMGGAGAAAGLGGAAGHGAAAAGTQGGAVAAGNPMAAQNYAPTSRGTPVAWILALVVASLVGYLIGHAPHGGESDWMGIAIGLLLLLVGAAGFEFGRRAASPVITVDPVLLARLITEAKR